jgi:hypothetical protein
MRPSEDAIGWNLDGSAVFVDTAYVEVPLHIYLVSLQTGHRELWKTVQPPDQTGAIAIGSVIPTPDGRGYAYHMVRSLSNLYVLAGLPL